MPPTIIDSLYTQNSELLRYLEEKKEVSFQATVGDNFRKTLLLACASYFESQLMESIKVYFRTHTHEAEIILEFVQKKAMERQYHTYFDWEGKNANQFFGLFGEKFKNFMKVSVKQDEKLDKAIKAFLEIGGVRNALVHQNFAVYALPKTVDEIYDLYGQGLYFIEIFPQKLEEFTVSARVPNHLDDNDEE